jgi:hypothetical protein
MQLGNVLTFCKVTSITKKVKIKTRTKINIMHKNFFKERKQVFHKKPTNKKNKCFIKKLTKNIIPQKN